MNRAGVNVANHLKDIEAVISICVLLVFPKIGNVFIIFFTYDPIKSENSEDIQ